MGLEIHFLEKATGLVLYVTFMCDLKRLQFFVFTLHQQSLTVGQMIPFLLTVVIPSHPLND